MMSSTVSVHSAKEVSSAPQAQPVEPVNEYADAEQNYQPKSIKFWIIIIGMYLSMFLVALVSLAIQVQTHISSLHEIRIEQLLQRPFHVSLMSSVPFRTSGGMAVPIC